MEALRAKIEKKRLENRRAAKSKPSPVKISMNKSETLGSTYAKFSQKSGKFSKPAAFNVEGGDDEDDMSDEELDPKTQEALDKLVATVLAKGISAEQDVKSKNSSNPSYWFLNDQSSAPYKKYLKRLQSAGVSSSGQKTNSVSSKKPPVINATSQLQHSGSGASQHVNDRKRKSRWGDKIAGTQLANVVKPPTVYQAVPPPVGFSQSGAGLSRPGVTNQHPSPSMLGGIQSAGPSTSAFGPVETRFETEWSQKTASSTLDHAGSSNVSGQTAGNLPQEGPSEAELAALRAQMQARAVALRALEKIHPPGAVDVEDEILRGSWEHAKRREEMEKTKREAEARTQQRGSGKHHLSDFLPPDEYQKLMERANAAKQGIPVDKSEYQDSRLTDGNKGFQLLQRMGWQEGSGLGSSGQGIVAPVNSGRVEGEKLGLGAGASNDVAEGDDEYSVYRKRMMVAYKFRPNPLNNPRRQYY